MERIKLKRAVIFLLCITNLFLLGNALVQHRQNISYRQAAMTEAVTYLKNHGIEAEVMSIPWESALPDSAEEIRAAETIPIFGDPLPEKGDCALSFSYRPETMAVKLANGLNRMGIQTATIDTVEEGYRYDNTTGVLTPMWKVKTDRGVFLLNGSDGTVTVTDTDEKFP